MIFSEVILTLGSSKTVLEFLCAAKEKKRSFKVFVAEGAPRLVVRAILPIQDLQGMMMVY
jgi:translation initiation factor 2B subunit (eIF-2B alpha/beta/delta family)